MQGLETAAHPIGEHGPALRIGFEVVGVDADGQPLEPAAREPLLELLAGFTVGDEARVQPLHDGERADLAELRAPRIQYVSTPSRQGQHARKQPDRQLGPPAPLQPEDRVGAPHRAQDTQPLGPVGPSQRRRRSEDGIVPGRKSIEQRRRQSRPADPRVQAIVRQSCKSHVRHVAKVSANRQAPPSPTWARLDVLDQLDPTD